MEPAHYIFVDIDGVLNTRNHLVRQQKNTGQCSGKIWCPIACNNLRRLCKNYGARIVVSSTWRHYYDLDGLKWYFSENGIDEEYIIGTTPADASQPDGQNYCRGHEIADWLRDNASPNPSYLILDDTPDMLQPQGDRFVQVNPVEGFACPQAFMRALQIMNQVSGYGFTKSAVANGKYENNGSV